MCVPARVYVYGLLTNLVMNFQMTKFFNVANAAFMGCYLQKKEKKTRRIRNVFFFLLKVKLTDPVMMFNVDQHLYFSLPLEKVGHSSD